MSHRYDMGRVPVHFPVRASEPYVDQHNWLGASDSYLTVCLDTELPFAPRRPEFDRLVAEARKLLAQPVAGCEG